MSRGWTTGGWRYGLLTWGLGCLIMLAMLLLPLILFGFLAAHSISIPVNWDNR